MNYNMERSERIELSISGCKPDVFPLALTAHIDWKMKLSRYIAHPDNSLDPEKVCVDNACALGKWLYGDGSHYVDKHPKTFSNLKTSHADFHKTADRKSVV